MSEETIEEKCNDCSKVLIIPMDIWDKAQQCKNGENLDFTKIINSFYETFYISPGFYFYCDANCYNGFVFDL